jgi:hypothetical protein
MTILVMTILIMTILTTLNMGDITCNDITFHWFYLQMTLLIKVNKKHICNVTFINVINKVSISKVFITIVVVS